jgi:outer membrane protein OmpA-like peptidoglycan-associated protein
MVVSLNIAISQNLVLNPSFEENDGIPVSMLDFKLLKKWKLIKVNAIYIHEYADYLEGSVSAINNYYGSQMPHSGHAYVCFFLADDDGKETGSLIQGQLLEPLIEGKCYYTEVYLSCAELLSNYSSNFEFIFSDTAFSGKIKNQYYQNLIPSVSNPLDNFITDKENWVKISGVFKAKGGEKYLLIGSTQKIATRIINCYGNQLCPYYLDDVSVIELPFCPDDEFSVDSVMIFKNLNFETGKSVILESSYEELNKLVTYLNLFSELNIEISGHTDNVGTDDANQILSQDRAKSVCDYLISKGISSDRLKSSGYGSTKPIADNSTDEGKAKNRRVEFIIFEK